MADQAARLRELTQGLWGERRPPSSRMRTIAIVSGKGGVGKTNLVVNLALVLGEMNLKVMVFDADLGLANVDVLMGLEPGPTLYDVVSGEKSMRDVIVEGPRRVRILPGASGIAELANLDTLQRQRLVEGMREFEAEIDLMLVDTGAGISRNVIGFAASADEVLLVVTPEPTSMTDAYSFIKVLARFHAHSRVNLVINRVKDRSEAEEITKRFSMVAKRFLSVEVHSLGYMCDHDVVGRAVMQQQPFVLMFPHSRATGEMRAIARELIGMTVEPPQPGGFIAKLTRLFG